MARVVTAPTPIFAGVTLVHRANTKEEKLACLLKNVHSGDVYKGEHKTATKSTDPVPAHDTWAYVGSKNYNVLLEKALNRAGARKPHRQVPSGITKKTEQFLKVLDVVGDYFGNDRLCDKASPESARRKEAKKRELLQILGHRKIASKRSCVCRRVPENGPLSSAELPTHMQDVPLKKWELETVESKLVKNTSAQKKPNDGTIYNIIHKQEARGHSNTKDRGIPQNPVDRLSTLCEERQAWIWIDSVENSDCTDSQNQGYRVPHEEATVDLIVDKSQDAKHIGLHGDTRHSTEETCVTPHDTTNEVLPMGDTVSVGPQNLQVLDDLTLNTEIKPSQMPVLELTNVVKNTQETLRQHKKKRSKRNSKKTTLAPLDLDQISGFYVVNASADWAFD